MKFAFLISGIIELIGAYICYFSPDLIYVDAPPYLLRLYGLAALSLGIINIMLYKHYVKSRLTKVLYLTIMFFHGAVAMMTYGSQSDSLPYQLPIILTHLTVFVIFFIMYMKELEPDDNTSKPTS